MNLHREVLVVVVMVIGFLAISLINLLPVFFR